MQPVRYNFMPQQQYMGGVAQFPAQAQQTGLSGGVASPFGATVSADQSAAPLANSFSLQGGSQNPMMGLLTQMMQMMTQMLQLFMNQNGMGSGATGGGNTGGTPVGGYTGGGTTPVPPGGGTTPVNTGTDTTPVGGGTAPVGGGYGGTGGGTTTQPDVGINGGLNNNDLLNYVLAGSQGGAANPDGSIKGQFAQDGSRFATAGANEFDAAVAKAYTAQFKGYALGLDSVYTPGQDTPQKIANNLETALNTQMTPEAELISKVAAVYRGDIGGVGAYNNEALGGLLTKWGRQDIAAQPGVGKTDIESIGGVVKALNEEKDPSIRQAWLQDIFDFKNGSGSSPSGAVPDAEKYQSAINVVQNGTLDKLLDNYNKGIKTDTPVDTSPNGAPVGPTTDAEIKKAADGEIKNSEIDRKLDIHDVQGKARDEMGLNEEDRAVLHMWGRQMAERGQQNGDIYLADGLAPKEAEFAKKWAAEEKAQYGTINGSKLDEAFFALNDRMRGLDPGTTSSKYAGRELHASSGKGTTFRNDIAANTKEGGLSEYEQGVLRLWGHEPLFNGGKIDGSILGYTIGNDNALDGKVKSGGNAVDGVARSLLEADFMTDGTRNGDAMGNAFIDVVDKLYNVDSNGNNRIGTSANAVKTDAMTQLKNRVATAGTSVKQAMADVGSGMKDAISNAGDFVKEHPVISTVGAGGLAAATAVCPYLGGLAVGAAGIGAAQKMMSQQSAAA